MYPRSTYNRSNILDQDKKEADHPSIERTRCGLKASQSSALFPKETPFPTNAEHNPNSSRCDAMSPQRLGVANPTLSHETPLFASQSRPLP